MLRKSPSSVVLSARGLRFGIAAAEYNRALADGLLANCVATLTQAGAKPSHILVWRVPGSFEVTAAAARLARTGKCDCVIGLGVLLQGETKHADHIGAAVAQGLTRIAIELDVPTVFGIITANNLRQAQVRSLSQTYNRGREAAHTAIRMARLWKTT